MSRFLLVVIAALTGMASALEAQIVPKEYFEMMTAMQAAQARAIRPGDEALGCPALEKELVASMNDPAIKAYAAKNEAAVQKELAALEQSKTPQTAAAFAASLGAGGGWAALMASPNPVAQAQTAQNLQAEQMKQVMTIMPLMIRSQRVMQLAFLRQCAWVTGAGLFPGAGLTGAVPGR